MSIEEVVQQRGISEILHFTTNNGLVGILRQGCCKARALLRADETLTHILKLNTEREYDRNWKGYVNLSVSRINTSLFESSTRVNHQFRWRILAFSPDILSHPGVLFTTTNNAYYQHLSRGGGVDGFNALFTPTVAGKYGALISRPEGMPDAWTTDVQAEVLYPQHVSTDHLMRIYVRTDEEADSVHGKFATFGLQAVPIEVRPDKFL